VYVILPVIAALKIKILYVRQPPGQLNGTVDGDGVMVLVGVGVAPPDVGVLVGVNVFVGVIVLVGVMVLVGVKVLVGVMVFVGVMVLVGVGVGDGHGN
jgi:hypothetical protein